MSRQKEINTGSDEQFSEVEVYSYLWENLAHKDLMDLPENERDWFFLTLRNFFISLSDNQITQLIRLHELAAILAPGNEQGGIDNTNLPKIKFNLLYSTVIFLMYSKEADLAFSRANSVIKLLGIDEIVEYTKWQNDRLTQSPIEHDEITQRLTILVELRSIYENAIRIGFRYIRELHPSLSLIIMSFLSAEYRRQKVANEKQGKMVGLDISDYEKVIEDLNQAISHLQSLLANHESS